MIEEVSADYLKPLSFRFNKAKIEQNRGIKMLGKTKGLN